MANEKISQLPTVSSALLTDAIPAVQAGVTVRESLQQIVTLANANLVLANAGTPQGTLAGTVRQLCFDTTNFALYVCSSTGSASTAVWKYIGQPLLPTAQGGTGVASPTTHTLPVAAGSSAMSFVGPLTNGQLLIGSTGANPSAANITAGSNISITNGAGSITIAATGSASFSWTDVTGTTQTMVADNGYVPDNAGLVTLTLPVTAAFGTRLAIVGNGAGGWRIAQNASQNIKVGSVSTTTGTGGSVSSTNRYDSIELLCTVANTTWVTLSAPQSSGLTIV